VAQILNTKYTKFTYILCLGNTLSDPKDRTQMGGGGGGGGREEGALESLVIKKKKSGER